GLDFVHDSWPAPLAEGRAVLLNAVIGRAETPPRLSSSLHVGRKVHPLVEHADDEHTMLILLEEDAMATTRRRMKTGTQVVPGAAGSRAGHEPSHRVAKFGEIAASLLGSPEALGVASNG